MRGFRFPAFGVDEFAICVVPTPQGRMYLAGWRTMSLGLKLMASQRSFIRGFLLWTYDGHVQQGVVAQQCTSGCGLWVDWSTIGSLLVACVTASGLSAPSHLSGLCSAETVFPNRQ
jgi:hypothetical protein